MSTIQDNGVEKRMDMVSPRIETLEETEVYGKFVIEPQERGFGTTLGNALRRVLLSSIQGAAVTSIKVDGVLHEFQTLPGVKEDATELILNLREVNVKMTRDGARSGEVKTVRIDKHGPGVVTASDIEVPPELEIANPEAHIATLNDESAHLSMEMTIEVGRGYVLPEKQERVKDTIGVIPVGALFSPVRRVNYTVEPTRVGHKTDYDRLVLEVITNGTIMPSDAISEAAKILDKQLRLFFDFSNKLRTGYESFEEDIVGFEATRPPDARIEELDFSVRTYNCLKKANVLTMGELVQLSESDLMSIRNFGRKSLTEIRDKLVQLGLSLKKGKEGSSPIIFESDGEDEVEVNNGAETGEEPEADKEEYLETARVVCRIER